MSDWVALVVMVVLLAINAFFVGAEFSFTASRKAEIEPLVKDGKRGAASALIAVENVSEMLAVCQLGITLASTGLGVVAEPAIAHLLLPLVLRLGLPPVSAHSIAIVVALLIVLYLHVVVGEMIPKYTSVSAHTRLILIYSPPMVAIEKSLRPVISAMNRFANSVVRLFGLEPQHEVGVSFTVEEMSSIVEKSREQGVLEDDLGLLSGTLEFSAEVVSGVMVGLENLVTLPTNVTPVEAEKTVARTGFSRFPVVDETGSITGYLHIKDVIAVEKASREKSLESWRIRSLITVTPQMEVEDALRVMQKQGTHLAGVVDSVSPGAVIGVIFLEDILEELVGEVRDLL